MSGTVAQSTGPSTDSKQSETKRHDPETRNRKPASLVKRRPIAGAYVAESRQPMREKRKTLGDPKPGPLLHNRGIGAILRQTWRQTDVGAGRRARLALRVFRGGAYRNLERLLARRASDRAPGPFVLALEGLPTMWAGNRHATPRNPTHRSSTIRPLQSPPVWVGSDVQHSHLVRPASSKRRTLSATPADFETSRGIAIPNGPQLLEGDTIYALLPNVRAVT